jgi:hypothetical protein
MILHTFGSWDLTAALVSKPPSFFDLEGGVVVKPGGWCAPAFNQTGGTAGTIYSVWWEEVDA